MNNTEMTPEAKENLFHQYYGVQVHKLFMVTKLKFQPSYLIHNNDFLSLKSLSSITDEDAIEVAKLMGLSEGDFEVSHRSTDIHIESYSQEFTLFFEDCSIYFNDFDTDSANTGIDYLSAYDFLRSKGYALPFMGWSVEQMIEAGWIKIAKKGGSNGNV
jgi:hypothetical protein